jgi:hypothetical protein
MQLLDDIGYDPFDVRVMRNPHPYYKRLRAEQPVYYTPKYDTYWLSRGWRAGRFSPS